MSKTFIEPATDHVIIAEMPDETIIDGITLPDNVKQQEMNPGLVVFVGPQVSEYTKPEDIVLFGPYAGKHIIVNGQQFRLLKEGQIEAYLRKTQ
jgi:co-chaperonin GroES (HSP10)